MCMVAIGTCIALTVHVLRAVWYLAARGSPRGNITPVPSLGVPAFDWGLNALHGVQSSCGSASCATSFPMPNALGATFNTSLVKDMAAVIGVELRALWLEGATEASAWSGQPHIGLDTWCACVGGVPCEPYLLTSCIVSHPPPRSPNINIARDPRFVFCVVVGDVVWCGVRVGTRLQVACVDSVDQCAAYTRPGAQNRAACGVPAALCVCLVQVGSQHGGPRRGPVPQRPGTHHLKQRRVAGPHSVISTTVGLHTRACCAGACRSPTVRRRVHHGPAAGARPPIPTGRRDTQALGW